MKMYRGDLRYASVCSGIEAPTVAWEPLGWKAAWFSEIDAFPSAILQHHYPEVPNLGDMNHIHEREEFNATFDVLIGGTPCQSFSVAGLRKGMADPRGNLALVFLSLVDRARPLWVVWENVPGVLSSNKGRDIGSFLGALGQLGYGWAYRVMDAQYYGVPQRRRRVFVVGYLGDWRPAAAVLFERHSLSGDSAPSRKKGERVAPSVTSGPPFSRTGNERVETEAMIWPAEIASTLNAHYGDKQGLENQHINEGAPLFVPHKKTCNHEAPIVALQDVSCRDKKQNGRGWNDEGVAYSLDTTGTQGIAGATVRRLTPRECERLQGFPDDYTLVPFRGKLAADSHRYKALGNSMAVPVVRWLGQRIQAVDNERRLRHVANL